MTFGARRSDRICRKGPAAGPACEESDDQARAQEERRPGPADQDKRDFERASTVAKRLSGQKSMDSTAELRLQSLLRELDKFDEPEEATDENDPGGEDYSGPRRRWSDDASGGE